MSEESPVPLLQRESEFLQLLALYRAEAPTSVLELGVGPGGSLFHWLRNARDDVPVLVVAVDTFAEYDNRALFSGWVPPNVRLEVVAGRTSSPQTVATVLGFADAFDWVFVDADHSYEAALTDWMVYGRRAHTCVFHDVASDPKLHPEIEVGRLFDELRAEYEWVEIADEDEPGGWGGIGVIWP